MEEFIKLDAETQRKCINNLIFNYYIRNSSQNTKSSRNDEMPSTRIDNFTQRSIVNSTKLSEKLNETSLNVFQSALLIPNNTINPTQCIPPNHSENHCINRIQSDETLPEREESQLMLKLDILDFYQSYLNTQNDDCNGETTKLQTWDNDIRPPSNRFECEKNTNLYFGKNQDANPIIKNSTNEITTQQNGVKNSPIMNCLLNNQSTLSNSFQILDDSPTLSRCTFQNKSFNTTPSSLSSSSPTLSSISPTIFHMEKSKPDESHQFTSSSLNTRTIMQQQANNPKTHSNPSKNCTNIQYKSFSIKDSSKSHVNLNSTIYTRNSMKNAINHTNQNTLHLRRRGFPPAKISKSSAKQSAMQFHFPLWTFHSSSSMQNKQHE